MVICGMVQSKLDPCLFVGEKANCIFYVDGLIFWACNEKDIHHIAMKLREVGVDLEQETDAAGRGSTGQFPPIFFSNKKKIGKTCQSPSLIAEHFPCTVMYFTTCSLPPFSVCTFNLLPKSDNVVTFYQIYLHFPTRFLFTSPSSRPLFMYLTHVPS
jgi:hypothetical protein